MERNESIAIAEILVRTDEAFESLEKLRINGLENARDIQQIHQDALIRERARLFEKYGTADHPRIGKIDAYIAFNQEFLPAQEAQIEMVKTEIPKFGADTWRIHGMVLDGDGNPVEKLTVALYDTKGKWVRELGAGKTNEKGYYLIDVVQREGGGLEKFRDQALFLTLTEENGRLFCQMSEPLHIAIGMIDYREVIKGVTACKEVPGEQANDRGGPNTSKV